MEKKSKTQEYIMHESSYTKYMMYSDEKQINVYLWSELKRGMICKGTLEILWANRNILYLSGNSFTSGVYNLKLIKCLKMLYINSSIKLIMNIIRADSRYTLMYVCIWMMEGVAETG